MSSSIIYLMKNAPVCETPIYKLQSRTKSLFFVKHSVEKVTHKSFSTQNTVQRVVQIVQITF